MRISDWSSDVCSSDLVNPAGYILFRRNVADPAQLRALTADLRSLSGRDDLPILIDQEGGRVARLQPPHWPVFPPGSAFDRLYDISPIGAIEAARHHARALGLMLADLGITVDCLRSEGRSGGKECVSKCRSRWSPYH